MGATWIYLRLELKRIGKLLPCFLAGVAVLAFMLCAAAYLAGKSLYEDQAVGRIKVGVAMPEHDPTARLVVSMLSSLDSVKSLCDFEYLSEKEGERGLRDGSLYAFMKVPEGFVEGIMSGVNQPVTIMVPDRPGPETQVFRELLDAGVRTLGTSQAGIYAADDYLSAHGMADSISAAEKQLNDLFLSYAMFREDYFRSHQVSAYGDVSPAAYYGVSLSVLFLLLCGIPASSVLRPESLVMRQKLRLIGIGRMKATGVRVALTAVMLAVVLTPAVGAACWFGAVDFAWPVIPVSAVVCLTVSSMIVCAYEVAGSPITGVMLLFLSSIGMMFLSGGFIPEVFLPGAVRSLSRLMPTTLLIRVTKGFVSGETPWASVVWMCLMGMGFYCVAAVVRRRDD